MTILLYIADGAFGLLGASVLLASAQNKRIGLLLPAAAYGVSGPVSFALESWWPLFLGFSLSRLLGVMEVGTDPQPARRPSSTGILVNLVLHVWAGVVGADLFLFSIEGALFAALLAVVVQGFDTVAFYYTYRRLLADSPAEVRSQLPIKVAWLFVMKVIWYGLITLLAAAIVRYLV